MLKLKTALVAFGAAIVLAATAGYGPAAQAGDWPTEEQCKEVAKDGDTIIKGWCTAISRRAGNCLACHQAMVNPWPEGFPVGGNIAPPLVAMAARFPQPRRFARLGVGPYCDKPHYFDATVRSTQVD